MKVFNSITSSTIPRWIFVQAILLAPQAVWATTWQATAGAQTTDEGIQALAFLANELWVHAGDSITWTFATDEIHTVTFLKPQQVRPARPGVLNPTGVPGGGCPGTTPDGSSFDGSTCVTSPEKVDGPDNTYTVTFPKAGNFKLVCLVHNNMSGAVHVLAPSELLPHDQAFYDDQARKQQTKLLKDGVLLEYLEFGGPASALQSSGDTVTVGLGEIGATGGGSHTVSVMRFMRDSIVVRVGDTVEWTNTDPVAPHTVTFGGEPLIPPNGPGLMPASANVTVDSDGARHAVLTSPADSVHSGFLQSAFQDRGPPNALPQTSLGTTRFRVTFTTPGTFNYTCALHDDLGMVGQVIVQ
jgi:plastocyanin